MIPLLAVDPVAVAAAAAGGAVVVVVICLCVLVSAAVWQTSRSVCLCICMAYIYIFDIEFDMRYLILSSNSFVWWLIRFHSERSAWRGGVEWVFLYNSWLFVYFVCVCECVYMCVFVCMGRDKSRDVERTRISRKRKREKIYKKTNLWIFLFTNVPLAERGWFGEFWGGIGWVVVGIEREREDWVGTQSERSKCRCRAGNSGAGGGGRDERDFFK